MYKVGDKVRIKRTNTIHEIESIVIVDCWFKLKLKGLCFTFWISELESVPTYKEKVESIMLDKLIKDIDTMLIKQMNDKISSWQNKHIDFTKGGYTPNSEPIKKVPISEILRVGDLMRVKRNGYVSKIIEFSPSEKSIMLFGCDDWFLLEELEIVTPNKPVRYEPKLKYVSIDNFKVGDIVEKDGFLFEILEIKLSKFKLRPLNKDFYIEASCKDFNKCKELKAGEIIRKTDFWYYNGFIKPTTCEGDIVMDSDSYFRVEKQTQEPEFDFIAIWQKEREFYLIESKGGSLSRMDKPEFEEYCEKMDRLNVKYRIIE